MRREQLSLFLAIVGLVALQVAFTSPAWARPEEVRETRDELDEEVGELDEECAEDNVGANFADIDIWIEHNVRIADLIVAGRNPADDPALLEHIRATTPADNPYHYLEMNEVLENWAGLNGDRALLAIIPESTLVFEAAAGTPHGLKVAGMGLVGLLLVAFGRRIIAA